MLKEPIGGSTAGCARRIYILTWEWGGEEEVIAGGLLENWDETGGLALEERRGSEDHPSAFLAGLASGFPGDGCMSWWLRQRDR